eukprot:Nk52_evm43s2657 gene=Nk52_evmTU43s2657
MGDLEKGFSTVPDEIVVHIFAHMSLRDFAALACVCKRFHMIANDDMVWRDSLEKFLGFSVSKHVRKVCGKDSKWKNEYIARLHLSQLWGSGCGMANTFNATSGKIDRVWAISRKVSNDDLRSDLAVVCSLPEGNVTVCNIGDNPVREQLRLFDRRISGEGTCVKFAASRECPKAYGKLVIGTSLGYVFYMNILSSEKKKPTPINQRHRNSVSCIDVRNGFIASGDHGGSIHLSRMEDGEVKQRQVCGNAIESLILGDEVVVVLTGTTIEGYGLDLENRLFSFEIDANPLFDVYEKEGILLTSTLQGEILLYDFKKCILLSKMRPFRGRTRATCFNWDKEYGYLCLGSSEKYVNFSLLDVDRARSEGGESKSACKNIAVLKAHKGYVRCIAMDSFKVISCGNDGFIKLFDKLTGTRLGTINVLFTGCMFAIAESCLVVTHDQKMSYCIPKKIWSKKSKKLNSEKKAGKVAKRIQDATSQKDELKESLMILKEEVKEQKEHAKEQYRWVRRANKHNIEGLSEEEQIQYAEAMSQEDALGATVNEDLQISGMTEEEMILMATNESLQQGGNDSAGASAGEPYPQTAEEEDMLLMRALELSRQV